VKIRQHVVRFQIPEINLLRRTGILPAAFL